MTEPRTVIPPILYKYRDGSPYTEAIFEERKIWLSVAANLNDPLECKTGVIPEDWKQQTIRQMEIGQLMGMVGLSEPPKTLFSLDQRKTKLWLRKFKKLSYEDKIKEMRSLHEKHGIELSDPRKFFENLQIQLSKIGIFSLSAVENNQPMWAHYAENHAGLSLGFSTERGGKLGDPKHTLQVNYSAEKPAFQTRLLQELQMERSSDGRLLSVAKLSFDDPVFRASFSTKPPAWSYEQEWRYVEEAHGLHDFPGELVSVTFGCRMSRDRRNHYRSLIDRLGTGINLSEAYITHEGLLGIRPIEF
jgi:hypothetical protein